MSAQLGQRAAQARAGGGEVEPARDLEAGDARAERGVLGVGLEDDVARAQDGALARAVEQRAGRRGVRGHGDPHAREQAQQLGDRTGEHRHREVERVPLHERAEAGVVGQRAGDRRTASERPGDGAAGVGADGLGGRARPAVATATWR